MNTLYVILGAAVGAPARFVIDQYIRKFTNKPYGIFIVNILGSFLLGMTFKSSEKTYELLEVPILEKEMSELFEERRKQVSA